MYSRIKEKLSGLPMCPGVYIMKNADGRVIYVGKSKVLKNRVSQYFQNSKNHSVKTRSMVEKVADFEYMITDTESEALALECNLIKKYRPKYNILLKDDKQYPYIKITAAESFPRIMMTRQLKKDGSMYFGPYMNVLNVKEALEEIRKLFKIRSCSKKMPQETANSRPCLFYHIGQCSAPCTGKISESEYREAIGQIISVLNGNYKETVSVLTEKMKAASESLQFEKAAQYRDKIIGVKTLGEKQKITSSKGDNRDVIGIYREESDYCIQVFYYRDGKAVGSEYFTLENEEDDVNTVLESFVKQFYFTVNIIPGEILIPVEIEDSDSIAQWLTQKSGHRVVINVPQRGKKHDIINMVNKNARESLHKHNFIKNKKETLQNQILLQLTKLLGLEKTPFRIESYDISNISGAASVGAQIVYVNAMPQKKLYRRYNIKTVEGANDYESMREVIYRRINEAYKEEDKINAGEMTADKAKFLPLPDLILLDGGRGHVSAIRELFDTMGEEIPVFGLVKDDFHRTRGITDTENEFPVDKKSELFKFLACMQDEVHRYAITTHRKKREKDVFKSELDSIEGVGAATKKKLLEHFSGINAVKKAGIEELCAVTNEKTAKNIYNFFNGETKK